MTLKKAWLIIGIVLLFHAVGMVFHLYEIFDWYDVPMHFGGGLAMGALGLAIWCEGIEDVKFKGGLQRHLKWWLVPGVILGFVALIGVLWEVHEWLLDEWLGGSIARQPNIADTMADFIFDLVGGVIALVVWKKQ